MFSCRHFEALNVECTPGQNEVERLHERVLAVLELPPPPRKTMLRCRASGISVRGVNIDAKKKRAYYLRFEAGDFKCKTGCVATTNPKQNQRLDWKDRVKFDCPVGTDLQAQLFAVEAPPPKVEPDDGKEATPKKGKGAGKAGPKQDEIDNEEGGDEWMKARELRGIQVARGRVVLFEENGEARQEHGVWWPLTGADWQGEVELYVRIESMDHASARKVVLETLIPDPVSLTPKPQTLRMVSPSIFDATTAF